MSDTITDAATGTDSPSEDRAVSLRLEGLTKTFTEDDGTEVIAVDDVTLDIYDGEFIVLVGPSGCGKTTTLRVVAGLETPTAGRVYINGEDVTGLDTRERDVAMVFQNYALYPHKTVRDNLAFPLRIRKFPDDVVTERVADVSELLSIPELLDRRPADLSGGQQQRVALGRTIVRDPELFLFDEPLSNLDAKLRIQMRTELNRLHERVGKTSVYVTHDQAEAMTLGDRVAVMNDGRLQQIAPPQRVYDHPANRFVAGFIGEPPMNFFDVSVEERDGTFWVVADGFEVALPDGMARALAAGGADRNDLVFGVRPEDLQDAALLERDGVPAGRRFDATVDVVEPMGAVIDLTLRPDGGGEEFTARVDNDSAASSGDTVTLAVDVPETHLFDEESGVNLTG